MIRLDRFTLDIGPAGLRDISLSVKPGTWTFIVGPSGAGKTLILEAIAGLHAADGGRILLRGVDAAGVPPEKRGTALVYQDYSLFPHMTVAENIGYGLKLEHMAREARDQIVSDLLNRFRLIPHRDRYPKTLSGGEQQRVAIARALAIRPDILLLDEPFAALDPVIRGEHIRMLQQIQRERSLTIVQVSHSRDEAFALADQVVVIMGGKLVQSGTCAEVFFRPATADVARFAGIENIIGGTVVKCGDGQTGVDVNGTVIRVHGRYLPGCPVTLCIRGQDLQVSGGEPAAGGNGTIIHGTISRLTPMEYGIVAEIRGPCPLVAVLPRQDPVQNFRPEQEVAVRINPLATYVIPDDTQGES